MNKKREMVDTLLNRISAANVTYQDDGVSLRAPKNFWELYPDGHRNPSMDGHIEGELSCLDELSLGRILADDLIKEDMTFASLWREWGYAGYFKTTPSIIYTGGDRIPILRMRHDCYLHWFRGAGFQNSYDAYCDMSNGSDLTIGAAIRAVKCPMSVYPDNWDDDTDEEALENAWRSEWSVFRKAMFLAYIFRAGGGKQALWNTVWNHGDIFDEFVTLTDKVTGVFKLDANLTISKLRTICLKTVLDSPILFEVPVLVRLSAEDYRAAALLQFSETGVQLRFGADGQRHIAAIRFPVWSKDDWEAEAVCLDLGCEKPETLSKYDYYRTCWFDLATALFGLCGMDCGYGATYPQRGVVFDFVPLVFWDRAQCMTGFDSLCKILAEHAEGYPDYRALVNGLPAHVE